MIKSFQWAPYFFLIHVKYIQKHYLKQIAFHSTYSKPFNVVEARKLTKSSPRGWEICCKEISMREVSLRTLKGHRIPL